MEVGWFNPLRWLLEIWNFVRKEQRRKALFKSLVVLHNGEKVRVTWDGPLGSVELLQAPRQLDAGLRTALEQAAVTRFPKGEVKFHLDVEESGKSVMVYETDANFTWKRKLRGPEGGEQRYVMKAYVL